MVLKENSKAYLLVMLIVNVISILSFFSVMYDRAVAIRERLTKIETQLEELKRRFDHAYPHSNVDVDAAIAASFMRKDEDSGRWYSEETIYHIGTVDVYPNKQGIDYRLGNTAIDVHWISNDGIRVGTLCSVCGN